MKPLHNILRNIGPALHLAEGCSTATRDLTPRDPAELASHYTQLRADLDADGIDDPDLAALLQSGPGGPMPLAMHEEIPRQDTPLIHRIMDRSDG